MQPVGAYPCGRPIEDYQNLDNPENKSPNESRPSADNQNLDIRENDSPNDNRPTADNQNLDLRENNNTNTARPSTDNQNLDLQENSQEMQLKDAGLMIEKEWLKLPERFEKILLHEYIIMPNHFHCILEIVNDNDIGTGRPQGHAPTSNSTSNSTEISIDITMNKTIGDMMDAFKSITTVEYIRGVKTKNWPRFNSKLWQRDYYEHIIRNERSYLTISNYIINNPQKWKADKFCF